MESKCHKFFSQAKIHKFSKIYIIHIIYIYVYESFSTMLDKDLRNNIKKEEMEKAENISHMDILSLTFYPLTWIFLHLLCLF